jgi:glycosyltransferase involved in cell wall biosynthesis
MKISIIIPTLNEEQFLPLLLKSIQKQSFKDCEVIVADGHSKDNTAVIAENFGAKVVKGGMPAKGRNSGAAAARGEFLFFFDADVILPGGFLQKAYDEMQDRFLDLATCEVSPLSDLHMDKVLHNLANLSIRMNQYTNPHAGGFCILCTKRLFDRAGGFDETLTMAEDHDFVKRSSRFRPLRVLDSTQISVSVRRLEKEGRTVLVSKYIEVELYRIFKGELKTHVIDYEFGNFQKKPSKKQSQRLAAFEEKLIRMDKKLRELKDRYNSVESVWDAMPPKELIGRLKAQFEKAKDSLAVLINTIKTEKETKQQNDNVNKNIYLS